MLFFSPKRDKVMIRFSLFLQMSKLNMYVCSHLCVVSFFKASSVPIILSKKTGTNTDDCRWIDSMNPFRNWGEKAEREKEQNLMDLKTHWEVPCWKHGRFRALWGGRIRGIFKVRFEAKASKLSPYTAKRSDDQEVGKFFFFRWEEQWVYTCIFIIIFTYIEKSNSHDKIHHISA